MKPVSIHRLDFGFGFGYRINDQAAFARDVQERGYQVVPHSRP